MRSMNAFVRLLPLAPLFLMTACMTNSIGRATVNDNPGGAVKAIVEELCAQAWQGVSYDSKKDTAETVASARKNNAARKAFCVGGK